MRTYITLLVSPLCASLLCLCFVVAIIVAHVAFFVVFLSGGTQMWDDLMREKSGVLWVHRRNKQDAVPQAQDGETRISIIRVLLGGRFWSHSFLLDSSVGL